VIRVFHDLAAASEALAARVVSEAASAIEARGQFRIALSGGDTPVGLYRRLGSAPWHERLDWTRTVILFADERAVPRGSPERNDRLVTEALFGPAATGPERVRSMRAEADDLDAAALEYEREVETPIDLLLLGVGGDGHIASLFPGGAALDDGGRRVAVVRNSPKPPAARLTLTPRAIDEARAACVLVAGEAKAAAVARALSGRVTPAECPAALVAARDWYIDRAAAAGRH